MHPKKVLLNLAFVNEVVSKRQTYYVYENSEEYVLMSVNRSKENSYNFNVVPKEAVQYVMRTFAGRTQITTGEITTESRKPVFIKNAFDALNILYALCARGDAKIDKRYKGQKLYFNIRS